MRTVTKVVVAMVMSVVGAGTTLAGEKLNAPVVIDTVSRTAYGALGSARNSADIKQYIGCETYANALGAAPTVTCWAKNANGTEVKCSSQAAVLVQVVHGLNGDSFLQFRWDPNYNCTDIIVRNVSSYPPKNP